MGLSEDVSRDEFVEYLHRKMKQSTGAGSHGEAVRRADVVMEWRAEHYGEP